MRNTYSSPEIEILYISEDIITESAGTHDAQGNSFNYPEMPLS